MQFRVEYASARQHARRASPALVNAGTRLLARAATAVSHEPEIPSLSRQSRRGLQRMCGHEGIALVAIVPRGRTASLESHSHRCSEGVPSFPAARLRGAVRRTRPTSPRFRRRGLRFSSSPSARFARQLVIGVHGSHPLCATDSLLNMRSLGEGTLGRPARDFRARCIPRDSILVASRSTRRKQRRSRVLIVLRKSEQT